MHYRTDKYGNELSILGFGCMRFPTKAGRIDIKETEREIVHLKVIGEMTFQEIANLLNQPLGTVTWRYQEAIKKLRRCGYE